MWQCELLYDTIPVIFLLRFFFFFCLNATFEMFVLLRNKWNYDLCFIIETKLISCTVKCDRNLSRPKIYRVPPISSVSVGVSSFMKLQLCFPQLRKIASFIEIKCS